MEQKTDKITVQSPAGREIIIGKPQSGFISLFCNFTTQQQVSFINSLENKKLIDIESFSNYKDGTCSIVVKMQKNASYEDASEFIQNQFSNNVA